MATEVTELSIDQKLAREAMVQRVAEALYVHNKLMTVDDAFRHAEKFVEECFRRTEAVQVATDRQRIQGC